MESKMQVTCYSDDVGLIVCTATLLRWQHCVIWTITKTVRFFQSTDIFSALEVSATQWESYKYKSTVYITLHTLHMSDYLELPQFSVPQDPAESQACLSLAAELIRLAHTQQ